MNDERRSLRGEEFYLTILHDLETIAQDIDDYLLREDDDFEEEDDDYARLLLWKDILTTIIDNAEEQDMVDTLDLHPLIFNGKEI